MDVNLIVSNILSAPVLFFFLGMLAVWVKSDLEIPNALSKFFSLYLLLDIGFHGGYELYHNGFSWNVVAILAVCFLMASIIPLYSFFILKRKFDTANAAAIAATFGSISAVTFITTIAFLESAKITYGGYMVAGMALMESPAIIIGVILFQLFKNKENTLDNVGSNQSYRRPKWGKILNDAFFNGSVLLLVGALLIGLITGDTGWKAFKPFDAIFKGILTFYLLDNGIVAARRLKSLKNSAGFLIGFGILMPLFNAFIAIILANHLLGLGEGDALLFTVLTASASYIAVPAAMRLAVPESNPAFTVPVSLGIVFPFNIIVGIPLYFYLIHIL
ncbi:sodium-dependent bicarbonate transport family permease [marine bacterium AO1-C]|nr:sodium-dependent bicarbonate transport family permease [marine bacterium AO1-C]